MTTNEQRPPVGCTVLSPADGAVLQVERGVRVVVDGDTITVTPVDVPPGRAPAPSPSFAVLGALLAARAEPNGASRAADPIRADLIGVLAPVEVLDGDDVVELVAREVAEGRQAVVDRDVLARALHAVSGLHGPGGRSSSEFADCAECGKVWPCPTKVELDRPHHDPTGGVHALTDHRFEG